MSDSAPADGESADRIVVYSDYVCPFCYLGRESLDRYQQRRETPLEIDWRPFDLRNHQRGPDGEIDHTIDSGKDDDYYEQAKQNVRRLQDKYDVEMERELAGDIDSLPAQAVSYHIKSTQDYETWLAFDTVVFEALWQDGRDIGDRDVLCELAVEAGLGADVVDAGLADSVRDALSEQFDAAHRHQITGVPTFTYGEHAARGAVPPDHLERLVEGT
jgi:predicted DsbA family dithiol-disulfide isomerase